MNDEAKQQLEHWNRIHLEESWSRGATAALNQITKKARTNYNDFAETILRDKDGLAIRQAAMHRIWQVHIFCCWASGLHPAILAPFGHGKTAQLIVGFPPFMFGHDVNLRTKVVSNNDDNAMKRVMGISSVIHSKAYQFVFPHVKAVDMKVAKQTGQIAKDTQHQLYLHRPGFAIDPSVEAVSILKGGTGGRADLILFDDVVDEKNALQEPKMREKVVSAFDNVWMQRLEPDGRVLYVGTPWHQADLTHKLMERPAWCVLKQAISEDFNIIEQEVYNPPPGYPIPMLKVKTKRPLRRTRGPGRQSMPAQGVEHGVDDQARIPYTGDRLVH